MRKSDNLSGICLLVLVLIAVSGVFGSKLKYIRYSGTLIRVNLESPNPYFEFEDRNTFQTRQIHCDLETLSKVKEILAESQSSLDVDGKASMSVENKGSLQCDGKPNLGKRFRVGIPEAKPGNKKFVKGQVLESDPTTGQIVYSGAAGRRGYLTVSTEEATEYRTRLDRMETVEIRRNYRYDRVRRIFVAE